MAEATDRPTDRPTDRDPPINAHKLTPVTNTLVREFLATATLSGHLTRWQGFITNACHHERLWWMFARVVAHITVGTLQIYSIGGAHHV